jgi:2-methylcitrate dehydratase PrpD
MDVTRTIAEFAAATRLADVPQRAIDGAKIAILDTFGVALAASTLQLGRILNEHVASLGGLPQARVLGSGLRTSAPLAGLANGTLAHALDFDDRGHLSTHSLPSALAVAESRALSGERLLEAYIVAREVAARVTDAIEAKRKSGGGPTYRGSYRVGVAGPISGAVAAGKLLGLDAGQMARALGIAASSAMGLRRNQGTMTKALHAGNGAQNGIQAALLAQRGFTGDPDIFEAPLGLFSLLCLPGECDPARATDRLGRPFELDQPPSIKPFPACTPSHMPIEAVLKLKAEHRIAAADVESVDADFHTFSLFRVDPREAVAAGFSLPYLASVALIDGAVTVDHISDERIQDPAVRAMMARIKPLPEGAEEDGPERVTIHLKDGRSVSTEIRHARDITETAEIEAKFRDCATRVLTPEQAERLREQVARLETIANVNDLTLSVPSPAFAVRAGPGEG